MNDLFSATTATSLANTNVAEIAPHAGVLTDCYLPAAEAVALKAQITQFPNLTLSDRQLCDLELLLNGGFSPLTGFMTQADYDNVVENMRLANNVLWPMPITLDVNATFAQNIKAGDTIVLRDKEGVALALLDVSDIWQPDKRKEALHVFGSEDILHPAIQYLFQEAGDYYIGGQLRGLTAPAHYDFVQHRHTPQQLRALFAELGWSRTVAFQTRNPMHRAHVEITRRAAELVQGHLVIHPVVGMTKPGDIDHYSRVRCYECVIARQPDQMYLSLLPLAMRMGGPREAVWHAIIRQNYGFTHFIVGRDHAGPGKNSEGKDFYSPYAAQDLLRSVETELKITILPFQMMAYVKERQQYCLEEEVLPGETVLNISGTEFRDRLRNNAPIPEWFSYPEVVAQLRNTYPPRDKQGIVIFFTGLSGAGKSTIAQALWVKLLAHGGRQVTLLDGDHVRHHLSSELGFSKAHRDLNVQRIGYVASEIAKHGGIALCALIAPYFETRSKVQQLVDKQGGKYLEIFVKTSLEECENRDRKGLYAKARRGELTQFTGIDDPYEAPENPACVIDTQQNTVAQAVDTIMELLFQEGFLHQETSI